MKSKLDGLLAIMATDLPHPDWQFFAEPTELPDTPWATAPHGWTIRLCPTRTYLFGLPSVHYIAYSALPQSMNNLAATIFDAFRFVVYPSWRFLASGGCHVSADRLVIEAVRGSITALLEGKSSPDLFLLYTGPFYSHLDTLTGDPAVLPSEHLATLRSSCRRVSPTGLLTIVLEWSWRDDRRIVFHDWAEV